MLAGASGCDRFLLCFIVLPYLLLCSCETSIGALDPGTNSTVVNWAPLVLTSSSDHVFPSQFVNQGTTVTVSFQNVQSGVYPAPITYVCVFGPLVNGVLQSSTDCSQLPGTVVFSSAIGVLTWTPNLLAIGAYGIWGSASNRNSSAVELVTIDVRQAYTQTHLVADLDAEFGNLSSVAGNPQPKWRDLTTNGFDATLTSMLGTSSSGFTATTPYAVAFDGVAGHLDLGALVIPAAQTTMAFSTWVAPANAAKGKTVILGNGGDNGHGFVLSQSALAPGTVELQIGAKDYTAVVLSDSPTAYWRLGDGAGATLAADLSGHGHGGMVNGGLTLGVAGIGVDSDTAATFTSATTNVSFARVTLPAGLTFEAWVNTTDATAAPTFSGDAKNNILGDTNAAASVGFGVESGVLTYRHLVGATWHTVQSTRVINDGNWHHIAVSHVSGTGNVTLFVDGVLDTAGNITYATATAAVNILGAGNSANDFFHGSVDEPAFYSSALSTARVLAHFQGGRPMYKDRIMADSPVAYWRLGEAGNTAGAVDLSPNTNTGVYQGSGMTFSQLGATTGANSTTDDGDTAVQFDGSGNGWVNVTSSASLSPTAAMSVEAWVYFTGASFAAQNTVIGKLAGVGHGWLFDLLGGTPELFEEGTTSAHLVSTGGTIPTNQWVHMVGTYDGTTIVYYQNGAASGSQASSGAIAENGTAVTIGAGVGGGHPFEGYIDEVALYNYALSANQVAAHLNAKSGLVCRSRTVQSNGAYNFISGLWDATSLSMFVNGRRECSVSSVGTFITPASNLTVGATAATFKVWTGSVADLRIYSSGAATDPGTNFAATVPRFQGNSVGNILTGGLIFHVDAANATHGYLPYANGCAASSFPSCFSLPI